MSKENEYNESMILEYMAQIIQQRINQLEVEATLLVEYDEYTGKEGE